MIQDLTKILEKQNIEYKVEQNAKNGEINIEIFFRSGLKTMWATFHSQNKNNQIIIKFIDQPEEFEGIEMDVSKWDNFVETMILPAYNEESLNESVLDSWASNRTSDLLIFDDEKEVSKMYFIGLDDAETWSYLHQQFMMNSLIRPVCINEAGIEGSRWGAAQYKTAYSNSFINYEGITHNVEKDNMLFFISCNYLPNQFGITNLQADTDFILNFEPDKKMPIDLILALESLKLPLMDMTAIMKEIEENTENALFFTYVLLSYFGSTELLKFIPEIISTKNQASIDYLKGEYGRISNEEVKAQFHSILEQLEAKI